MKIIHTTETGDFFFFLGGGGGGGGHVLVCSSLSE